jgi:AAA15 family ATPase/GTPase
MGGHMNSDYEINDSDYSLNTKDKKKSFEELKKKVLQTTGKVLYGTNCQNKTECAIEIFDLSWDDVYARSKAGEPILNFEAYLTTSAKNRAIYTVKNCLNCSSKYESLDNELTRESLESEVTSRKPQTQQIYEKYQLLFEYLNTLDDTDKAWFRLFANEANKTYIRQWMNDNDVTEDALHQRIWRERKKLREGFKKFCREKK